MLDDAFNKIVDYAATRAGDATADRCRPQLRPLVQELLNEISGEIAAAWGPTDAEAEGLVFALGYLRTRYAGPQDPAPGCPFTHTRAFCGYEGCRES
jgi:hypothetical protein